jgi:hypothetical protein
MSGKVPTKKHETYDAFLENLEAWVGKACHWFNSQWGMDLAFDNPKSLMALLSWYVIVETKPGPLPWS